VITRSARAPTIEHRRVIDAVCWRSVHCVVTCCAVIRWSATSFRPCHALPCVGMGHDIHTLFGPNSLHAAAIIPPVVKDTNGFLDAETLEPSAMADASDSFSLRGCPFGLADELFRLLEAGFSRSARRAPWLAGTDRQIRLSYSYVRPQMGIAAVRRSPPDAKSGRAEANKRRS
jgi:hypothetical protein